MDGKDDDVKEDADGVDDQGQEDGVLAGNSNPDIIIRIIILKFPK